jgi:carbonic anhydrase/acetyltransferase-like protein (isoleucine patch superfamily)
MAQTKYRILEGEKVQKGGYTLYRIQAVRSFDLGRGRGPVRAGQKGGWVESERNLSHEDSAWIADEAKAAGKTEVFENGLLRGNARALDAWIRGEAIVERNASVNRAVIEDLVRVGGDVKIDGEQVWLRGRAQLYGNVIVRGGYIGEDAFLLGGIIDGSVFIGGRTLVLGGHLPHELPRVDGLTRQTVNGKDVIFGGENAFKGLIRNLSALARDGRRCYRVPVDVEA